ncbi:MAG: 16S rRNA (guanine(527)-N(7))-methyltransferase RsmG [Thermoanaerobaculaceae bacterium]|nr:16S rRNA (guanine(527)-N(7))-methyltransferase RsmG [Thermoanaerobaculaceae bacterium]
MNFFSLNPEKRKKIDEYLSLLFHFKEKFNITSFKDKEEALRKGINPLLKIVDYVEEGECLDIGSGSGIPALPLSILCEKTTWILLEPSQKKAGFLIKAAISLNLPVKVVTKSAEEYFKDTNISFSTITLRGVKITSKIAKGAHLKLNPQGKFIVFTGSEKEKEYCALLNKYNFEQRLKIEDPFATILINVPRGTKSE